MSKLADKLERLRDKDPNLWRIKREPHDYDDGTTHFVHVECDAKDAKGNPLTVTIGEYLTPNLAELLVTMRNNLDTIIAALRKSEKK